MIFVVGRIADLLILVFLAVVTVYLMSIADRWNPELRQIAGVVAIPELIGRATELGRPVHFTTGMGTGSLSQTETGPQIMAGLSVLMYIAQLCARNGIRLIVSIGQPDTIPILEEYIRDAYTAEGIPLPDMADTLRFHSREQFSFVSAVTGIMRRDRPAANIIIGPIWAESSQLVCSGAQVGAMQMIATARTAHIPWFAILSDYTLLGEEIYAAGAQISKDTKALNSLASQDVGKILAIVLIILGVLLIMAGNTLITDLLGI